MKRAIVHALFVLGLVGFGWWVHLSTAYPLRGPIQPVLTPAAVVGPWVWVPGAAGTISLVLCSIACFVAARRPTAWLYPLLLVPPALLGLSAAGYYAEILELAAAIGEPEVRERGYSGMLWWLSARGYAVQLILARGLLWTWLVYLAIAVAVGCTPVRIRTGFTTFRWAWPGATALSLAGLLFVYAMTHAGVFARYLHARHLNTWGDFGETAKGFAHPDALAILSPFLISLALLVVLAVKLIPLRPSDEDLSTHAPLDVSRARAVGGVAVVGACVTLGLTFWAMTSARLLLNTHTAVGGTAEIKQALFGQWGLHSPFMDYRAGLPVCVSLLVIALILAGPLLITALRARWTLLGSSLLLTVSLMTFAGARSAALRHLSIDLSPHCEQECTELDRLAAVMSFSRLQLTNQLLKDRCSQSMSWNETDQLRLVRTESDRCPDVAVNLRLHRDEVLIDGVPMTPPEAGAWSGPSCDPDLLHRVHATLEEKAEDARAVAARNPNNPFKGELLVIPDRSTPAGALDCLLAEAVAADFTEPQLVVARPGRAFPLLVRTIQIHADAALVPPRDTPVWTLHLTTQEARLTSPTGETWKAPSADLLADDARAVLPRLRGSPMLWVHRSEDLPLETDIAARIALTTPGLFVGAWTPPRWEEPEVWVPREKPNHPAVP